MFNRKTKHALKQLADAVVALGDAVAQLEHDSELVDRPRLDDLETRLSDVEDALDG